MTKHLEWQMIKSSNTCGFPHSRKWQNAGMTKRRDDKTREWQNAGISNDQVVKKIESIITNIFLDDPEGTPAFERVLWFPYSLSFPRMRESMFVKNLFFLVCTICFRISFCGDDKAFKVTKDQVFKQIKNNFAKARIGFPHSREWQKCTKMICNINTKTFISY